MKAELKDIESLAPMVKKLWPEHELEDLERILREYAEAEESAVFCAKSGEEYLGVALTCLRHDYVEGCETSPVGYLEGIYVDENHRYSGIARNLVAECENWAKEKGCTEFASDCELTNTTSLKFHLSIGFKEENRIICFRKNI
ncbi:MAG: GNAT family N-acetyltransferase [Clostridia bacterium]|nr:GNAT family N-acetyltransferase [Clostridia bacterium]